MTYEVVSLQSSNMLNEDVSAEKSLAVYSLVTLEVRNWLLRELDAVVPTLELLANADVRGLAETIFGKSKLVGM